MCSTERPSDGVTIPTTWSRPRRPGFTCPPTAGSSPTRSWKIWSATCARRRGRSSPPTSLTRSSPRRAPTSPSHRAASRATGRSARAAIPTRALSRDTSRASGAQTSKSWCRTTTSGASGLPMDTSTASSTIRSVASSPNASGSRWLPTATTSRPRTSTRSSPTSSGSAPGRGSRSCAESVVRRAGLDPAEDQVLLGGGEAATSGRDTRTSLGHHRAVAGLQAPAEDLPRHEALGDASRRDDLQLPALDRLGPDQRAVRGAFGEVETLGGEIGAVTCALRAPLREDRLDVSRERGRRRLAGHLDRVRILLAVCGDDGPHLVASRLDRSQLRAQLHGHREARSRALARREPLDGGLEGRGSFHPRGCHLGARHAAGHAARAIAQTGRERERADPIRDAVLVASRAVDARRAGPADSAPRHDAVGSRRTAAGEAVGTRTRCSGEPREKQGRKSNRETETHEYPPGGEHSGGWQWCQRVARLSGQFSRFFCRAGWATGRVPEERILAGGPRRPVTVRARARDALRGGRPRQPPVVPRASPQSSLFTFAAWSPFGPCVTSNCTRWPCSSVRNPEPPIAL